MKIISIKFQNLNSLKGEHEIRFTKAPFNESGLFAITGPTGAGKTTILDAITVALYGKVHRHNRDAFEIMTRNTAECFSEVEFEIKEVIYRAKWSLRRSHGKADGALQPAKMEVCYANTGEVIIAHPVKAVQDHIEALCGLDYNQFLRSVMLSQGDFTRFLKATENERSELLERMTDTGIYSEISSFIYRKAEEEKTKLSRLKVQSADVRLLSTDELAIYRRQLADFSTEEQQTRNKKQECEKQLQWLVSLQKLHERKLLLNDQLSAFETEYQSGKVLFDRLARHNNAVKYQPLLQAVAAARQMAEEQTKRLAGLNASVPGLRKTRDLLAARYQAAVLSHNEASGILAATTPIINDVLAKDSLIIEKTRQCLSDENKLAQTRKALEEAQENNRQRKDQLNELVSGITVTETWLAANHHDAALAVATATLENQLLRLNETHQAITENDRQSKALHEDLLAAGKQLHHLRTRQDAEQATGLKAINELQGLTETLKANLGGKTVEMLEAEAGLLPGLISLCEQQLQLTNRSDELQRMVDAANDLAIDKSGAIQQQNDSLLLLQKELQSADDHLRILQENLKLQLLIQKYEADRHLLRPEEACPLCGSTDHPFVDHDYKNERPEAEQSANRKEQELNQLQTLVNEKKVLISILEQDLKHALENEQKASSELLAARETFEQNNSRLPKPLDNNKPEIILAIIRKKQEELTVLSGKIHTIRNIAIKVKEAEQAEFRARENSLTIAGEIKQHELKLEANSISIARWKAENDAYQVREKEVQQTIVALLTPYNIAFNPQYQTGLLRELRNRADQYKLKNDELLQQQTARTKIESELSGLSGILSGYLQQTTTQLSLLEEATAGLKKLQEERFLLFENKDPREEQKRLTTAIEEKKSEQAQIQSALDLQEKELTNVLLQTDMLSSDHQRQNNHYDELSRQLLNGVQQEGLETVEQLQSLLLSEQEAADIRQLEEQIKKHRTELLRSIQDNDLELRETTAIALTAENDIVLKEQIANLDLAISRINQQTGAIHQQLKADEENRKQFASIVASIDLQQKDTTRWEQLSALVGSSKGEKFSRFAQGLTLMRLTELANKHLLQLNDRYRILKSANKDLELEIIDGYQADITRPMATLSGGESFLVSLALALGLSELASRKTQINSLFIDEGFGTLDAETLETAITALENLQANGKMIGIISHVAALKERISTQIQVNKQPGGFSSLKVVTGQTG